MRFTFLDKQKKLVMSALIGCAIDGIKRITIHTTLRINIKAEKDFIVKINIL